MSTRRRTSIIIFRSSSAGVNDACRDQLAKHPHSTHNPARGAKDSKLSAQFGGLEC